MGSRIVPVAMALAVLLGAACQGEPPVCLSAIYVDALRPLAAGEQQLIVRFFADDGSLAAPPPREALTPVVQGVPVGRFHSLAPVRGGGVQLVLVVDPELPAALFEPMRAAYRDLLAALGDEDRAALLTVDQEGAAASATLVPPAELRPRLDALTPSRTAPLQRLGATAIRPGGGPMGWIQAPAALLEQGLQLLATAPSTAPRRALVLLAEGRSVGRSWAPLVRWAAAAGIELHLVSVPPEGRLAAPGKIERPLYHYVADEVGSLPLVFDRVAEGVTGGHELRFRADRRGLDLLAGFAVRARLPRGGWEEFDLALLATSPATLSLDELRPLAEGRFAVTLRALTARGEPLLLAPADVALSFQGDPLPTSGPAPPPPPLRLGILATLPDSPEEGALLRQAMLAALGELGPGDAATLAIAGVTPFGAQALTSDLDLLRGQVAGLAQQVGEPRRDLESDLVALARELTRGEAAAEARRSVLVLSGGREVRNARGSGSGSQRALLTMQQLRRQQVVPLWVAQVPRGEYEPVRALVRDQGGGNLWTVGSGAEFVQRAGEAVRDIRRPLVLTFTSSQPLERLRQGLVAHGAYQGQPLESLPGLPRTPRGSGR